MPVHQFVQRLAPDRRAGCRNYWGYNTIGFFAPHNEYSASGTPGGRCSEFKAMVRALHEAGIEVILDVVYNHTAEGNQHGPDAVASGASTTPPTTGSSTTTSSYYLDYTGTGNSSTSATRTRCSSSWTRCATG